jgi:hypothetical protein
MKKRVMGHGSWVMEKKQISEAIYFFLVLTRDPCPVTHDPLF